MAKETRNARGEHKSDRRRRGQSRHNQPADLAAAPWHSHPPAQQQHRQQQRPASAASDSSGNLEHRPLWGAEGRWWKHGAPAPIQQGARERGPHSVVRDDSRSASRPAQEERAEGSRASSRRRGPDDPLYYDRTAQGDRASASRSAARSQADSWLGLRSAIQRRRLVSQLRRLTNPTASQLRRSMMNSIVMSLSLLHAVRKPLC